MRWLFLNGLVLALLLLVQQDNRGQAQDVVPATGWGSLSGKVTLKGQIPPVVNFVARMKEHPDRDCCLHAKATEREKIDTTWIVDPKTMGVANVAVWLKATPGKVFPIHANYKNRNEQIVMDQPHCAFIPRLAAFQPYYKENGKVVPTGQKMIMRNSASVVHNVRVIGNPLVNEGFSRIIPPKDELDVTARLKPQPYALLIECNLHPWMQGKLFVFDHPYYAITKEDGTFEMPIVPAGAEITLMAWHEGGLMLLTPKGQSIALQAGPNTFDISVTSPVK